MIAIGDDQLETQRLEIGPGIRLFREAVEHGEKSISLPELTGDLGTSRNVDDPDGRRGHLLRADDLGEPFEAVVGDDSHPEVGLLCDVRVGRHLRAGVRQGVEERRLPGVGKADDADPKRHGNLGAEAGARLACVSLRVEHAGEDEQEDAVLGL